MKTVLIWNLDMTQILQKGYETFSLTNKVQNKFNK